MYLGKLTHCVIAFCSEVPSQCDGHNNRVFAAKFHPVQTTEFVSGGWDSVLHFWDMRQRSSLRFIKGVHMCGEGLDLNKSGREVLQMCRVEVCSGRAKYLCYYNFDILKFFKRLITWPTL